MKKIFCISSILLSTLFFVACSSVAQSNVRPNYKLVDHKGVLAGQKIPAVIVSALTQPAEEISRKYFPDSYVFITNQKGRDLDGLMTWVKNFEIQSSVSKRIQTSIDIQASSSVSGNKDLIESSMNVVNEVVSKTTISGLQMEQDWWMKLLYEDGKEEYHYVVIYAIKKGLLDKFMQDAMDSAAAQQKLSDAEKGTINEFSEKLSENGYGLEDSKGEFAPKAFDSTVAEKG